MQKKARAGIFLQSPIFCLTLKYCTRLEEATCKGFVYSLKALNQCTMGETKNGTSIEFVLLNQDLYLLALWLYIRVNALCLLYTFAKI